MIPKSIKLLANDIKPFLNKLINEYSDIETIRLFGKRANGDHYQDSDWDLLVFANGRVLDLLKANIKLRNESEKNNIDLLVVFNGDDFKAPWKRPGEENKPYKESCLTGVGGFGWSILSEVEAEYTEVKDSNTRFRKAWRIWP
jgi:predicted nucleotidyltransferase